MFIIPAVYFRIVLSEVYIVIHYYSLAYIIVGDIRQCLFLEKYHHQSHIHSAYLLYHSPRVIRYIDILKFES